MEKIKMENGKKKVKVNKMRQKDGKKGKRKQKIKKVKKKG
jgi:hypothetical protein